MAQTKGVNAQKLRVHCCATLAEIVQAMEAEQLVPHAQKTLIFVRDELRAKPFCLELISCVDGILDKFGKRAAQLPELPALVDRIILNGLHA
jgi:FKBP12-rapamycin complex-associated protein